MDSGEDIANQSANWVSNTALVIVRSDKRSQNDDIQLAKKLAKQWSE
ncbi:MAG TPA: hypothetical protein VMA74_14890 [Dyella sp.]|nr:hypothetical protein [Dyella sp.]HUB91007.1 hypothetical protein [Dyella sp.]